MKKGSQLKERFQKKIRQITEREKRKKNDKKKTTIFEKEQIDGIGSLNSESLAFQICLQQSSATLFLNNLFIKYGIFVRYF